MDTGTMRRGQFSLVADGFCNMLQRMDTKQLADELGVNKDRLRYWRDALRQRGLISQGAGRGVADQFSDADVRVFCALAHNLDNGCRSVAEAIRLIESKTTPAEALARAQRADAQLARAHAKIVELRRVPWWKRLWRKMFGGGPFKRDGATFTDVLGRDIIE